MANEYPAYNKSAEKSKQENIIERLNKWMKNQMLCLIIAHHNKIQVMAEALTFQ